MFGLVLIHWLSYVTKCHFVDADETKGGELHLRTKTSEAPFYERCKTSRKVTGAALAEMSASTVALDAGVALSPSLLSALPTRSWKRVLHPGEACSFTQIALRSAAPGSNESTFVISILSDN
jgi:hypothetical protein